MDFLYKYHPKTYTISAFLVGMLLIDDLNSDEQNALGNWFMLAAQVLCTNSYFMQLKQNKKDEITKEETIKILEKTVKAIEKEIEEIKKLCK